MGLTIGRPGSDGQIERVAFLPWTAGVLNSSKFFARKTCSSRMCKDAHS